MLWKVNLQSGIIIIVRWSAGGVIPKHYHRAPLDPWRRVDGFYFFTISSTARPSPNFLKHNTETDLKYIIRICFLLYRI